MDSILTSVKKLLGIPEGATHYDMDIIIFINSAFSTLNQLGIGPREGFMIEDDEADWDDFICNQTATDKQIKPEDAKRLLQCVKQYVYQKVKLAFDPPSMSFHLEAINKQISELEWRMSVIVDPARSSRTGGVRSESTIMSIYTDRRKRFS